MPLPPLTFVAFETDLGPLLMGWTEEGLARLRFASTAASAPAELRPAWVEEAVRRLQAHLAGDRQDLSRIPVDLAALTPFRRRVAEVLRGTRPGQVLTYGDVALLAGRPGAARAVGQAVKANPLLILVPCHRVVGAKDDGGWSAFGSPEVKARLLELEQPHTEVDDASPAR
ncbi:MAG TPA: methylated-DNA--[protein]-cysteine S-methyltransferase [Holophagaceae bacterium]